MRNFIMAIAVFFMSATAAQAQQMPAPPMAQGYGAECARIAEPQKRDECVREAKSKVDKAKAGKGKSEEKAMPSKEKSSEGKKPKKAKK